MPDSWELTALGTVVQIINGDRGKNYPAKTKLCNEGDIPFISAANLEDGKISNENLKYLNDRQYGLLSNGKMMQNDIAFCIRGSLGKNGIFPFQRGAIASSLVILRSFEKNIVNQHFLFLYCNSPIIISEIKKYDNGTAQPNLAAKDLGRFLFVLPPLQEQLRITNEFLKLNQLIQSIYQ